MYDCGGPLLHFPLRPSKLQASGEVGVDVIHGSELDECLEYIKPSFKLLALGTPWPLKLGTLQSIFGILESFNLFSSINVYLALKGASFYAGKLYAQNLGTSCASRPRS